MASPNEVYKSKFGTVKLTSEILCNECKDGCETENRTRYDCKNLQSECTCKVLTKCPPCKCCRVCKHVNTRIHEEDYNDDHYHPSLSIISECDDSDYCVKCERTVCHYFRKFNRGDHYYSSDDSDESDSSLSASSWKFKPMIHDYEPAGSSGSSISSSSHDFEYPIIRVTCRSMSFLHSDVVKKCQKNLRLNVAETVAVNREQLAVSLGRSLTSSEVNALWEDYILTRS